MAVAVLENYMAHTAISDTESVFYVLIWIASLYAGPLGAKRLKTKDFSFETSFLSDWCPEGKVDDRVLKRIADMKGGILRDPATFERRILSQIHKYFIPLTNCLKALRAVFFPPAKTEPVDLRVLTPTLWTSVARPITTRLNREVFEELKSTLAVTKAALSDYEATQSVADANLQSSTESSISERGDTNAQEPVFVEKQLPPLRIRNRAKPSGKKYTAHAPPVPVGHGSARIPSRAESSLSAGKRSRDDASAVDDSGSLVSRTIKRSRETAADSVEKRL